MHDWALPPELHLDGLGAHAFDKLLARGEVHVEARFEVQANTLRGEGADVSRAHYGVDLLTEGRVVDRLFVGRWGWVRERERERGREEERERERREG
jgi:hypothetical protein